MAGYNLTRTVEEVLEHFEKDEKNLPSFAVHLHPEYWTLNHGSKFLYNNPVASLLDDIRAHRIPVDFLELFDSAKVPFYDGCMIVELLDYRPLKSKDPALEKPERTRVVLHPNSETLWADVCLLNQKAESPWTDQDALEIEARLLMATAPPLCLNPDPHLTRIANNVLRASIPTVPVSLKRKASALDAEEHESDKARRAKLMQYMNPRQHRSHAPNYRILETIQRNKIVVENRPSSTGPQPPLQIASTVHPFALQNVQPQSATTVSSSEGADSVQKKVIKKKKTDSSQSTHTTNDNGANPSPTPAPVNGPPINQYIPHLQPNGHHSPSPVSQPPIQPNSSGKQYPQPMQASSQPSQPQRPPQHPQNASPLSNFPAAAPSTQFSNSAAPPRNGQSKPNVPTSQVTPQQANPQLTSAHSMYPHIQIQQAATAQRLAAAQNQNGRATPQGQSSRSPMNPNAATTVQRGSPLVTNQAANSRSPMPNSQPVPQLTHPNQHANFSAMAQNQYALAHLRAMPNSQHLQPHMINSVPQPGGPSLITQGQQMQSSQDHQGPPQLMAQYPHNMYHYAQMGMNYGIQPGRLPPGYAWPMGIGRGMPVSGQHQMPGMANAAHSQQMLNVGKAVPGGMQGR